MQFFKWDGADQIEQTVTEQTTNWERLEQYFVGQQGYNVKDFGDIGNYKVNSNGVPLVGDAENALMDDSPAIQMALNKCKNEGGGIVFFPKGNYAIKNVLCVYSNTTVLMHPQATIFRNKGRIGAFFTNGDLGASYTGYNGQKNIKFIGGRLDGNIGNFDDRFNFYSVGHGYNLLFDGVYMKDCQTYHAIEMNSTKKGIIQNCIFDGWTLDSTFAVSTPDRRSEAVQFDGMYGIEVFGRFGAYDKTTCNDCTVQGCSFFNWNRGVGSHTSETGYHHKNIRVINNHFEGITDIAVVTCMWEGAVITGNTFYNCGGGVWVRVKDSTSGTFGYNVSDNTFRSITLGTSARHAIRVSGLSGTDKNVRSVVISGNTVESTADTGFYIEGCWRVSITGNVINSTGSSHGIALYNCGFGTISSNTVVSTGLVGIRLENSPLFTVVGNSVSNTNTHGIHLLSNSYSCTVSANLIRNANSGGGTNYAINVASTSDRVSVTGNVNQGTSVAGGVYITSGCSNCISLGNIGGGVAHTNNSTSGVSANNIA